MKKEFENSPKKRTLAKSQPLFIKKKSERPARWFCFMIAAILFVGGLTSGACNAANGPQEVHVGSELDFPPYALVDDNGQPTGFSVELIKAVTATMGLSVKVSSGSWDTVWNSLVSGQLDLLPIVAKTPERQHLVDFSLPHTESYDAFFMREGDTTIPNIAAAQGKEIVVMRSDAAHHQLMGRNFQGKLILVDTIPVGLKLISSGKHNAILCSKLIGTMSIKEHGITGLTGGPTIPDYKRTFSFAVKKGNTELLEKLNQGLLIVKTNGEYDRIYDKWLSFDDPWRRVQKYLLPTIITVIAIALIAGFWLMTLRRLVNKRTRELAEKNEMLHHAYDEMEARVQERTVELAQSNQSLQTEITEHKRVEEALRENEERFRLLFENMTSGSAIYTVINDGSNGSDYIIKSFNKTSLKIEGKTLEDVVGKSLSDLRPNIDNYGLIPVLKKVWQTGEAAFFPTRIYKDEHFSNYYENYIFKIPSGEVVTIYNDVTENKLAEEELKKKESFNYALFEFNPDQAIAVNSEGKIIAVNRAKRISGDRLPNIGDVMYRDYAGSHEIDMYSELMECLASGKLKVFPEKIYRGKILLISIAPFSTGAVIISNDITDRKLAEEKIKSSLLEKETMLKEIHHRVKNNLQVISSLLNMQSSYLQDEKAREIFQNSMDRVSTMAKIHTLLYQSEDLTRIDFGAFVRDLVGRLQQAYGIAGSPVGIHVNTSDVSLTMEASVPCGLILNELVANALKHAFPKGKGGEVNISMVKAGDHFVLKVQDNGIGFPEAVDFQNTKSLGLELVNLLVGQMNGVITLTVEGGTTFTITFPAVSNGG